MLCILVSVGENLMSGSVIIGRLKFDVSVKRCLIVVRSVVWSLWM